MNKFIKLSKTIKISYSLSQHVKSKLEKNAIKITTLINLSAHVYCKKKNTLQAYFNKNSDISLKFNVTLTYIFNDLKI